MEDHAGLGPFQPWWSARVDDRHTVGVRHIADVRHIIAAGIRVACEELSSVDFFSWFALGILFFVSLTLVYGLVALHEIPYLIAKKRNHPHTQAIHAGGWVSLFTLHAIWPFLWIWAMAYDPDHGYRGGPHAGDDGSGPADESLMSLKARIAELESELASGHSVSAQKKSGTK